MSDLPEKSYRTLRLEWQWHIKWSAAADALFDVCESLLDEFDNVVFFLVLWYGVTAPLLFCPRPHGLAHWTAGRWVGFAFMALPLVLLVGLFLACVFIGVVVCIGAAAGWLRANPPLRIKTRWP